MTTIDELKTLRPDDDIPADAKIAVPAGDLRDLVDALSRITSLEKMVESARVYQSLYCDNRFDDGREARRSNARTTLFYYLDTLDAVKA